MKQENILTIYYSRCPQIYCRISPSLGCGASDNSKNIHVVELIMSSCGFPTYPKFDG